MHLTHHQGQETDYQSRQEELLRACLAIFGLRVVTVAEFFLSLGRAVRYRLRHGLPLDQIANGYGLPISECLLVLQYAESSDAFKLQALVEDWSWQKIREGLCSGKG